MAGIFGWVTRVSNQSGVSDLCEVCGIKPKSRDAYKVYPYCSETCAEIAPNCPIPNCLQKGLREFRGACSARHLNTAVVCAVCRSTPFIIDGLCIECSRMAQVHRTRLTELPASDAGFKEAQGMLIHGWKKPQKPKVSRVFRVQIGDRAQEERRKYKSTSGECFPIPVWYSCRRACDLGAPNKQTEFCTYNSCDMCLPLMSVFTAFSFGQTTLSGHLGKGIYMTRYSSVADQFDISTTGSSFRVLLLSSLLLPARSARKGESVLSDNGDVFFKNPSAITPDYVICYQN